MKKLSIKAYTPYKIKNDKAKLLKKHVWPEFLYDNYSLIVDVAKVK